MLAALIGGAAAGVPGALVATPLLGAAKSVWLDVVEGNAAHDDEAGQADDEPGSATVVDLRVPTGGRA